jgi:hypothetical protein
MVRFTKPQLQTLRNGTTLVTEIGPITIQNGRLVATAQKVVLPPGRFPPSTPVVGDIDNSIGRWVEVSRSSQGADYAEYVTGSLRDPVTGKALEYRVDYVPADPGGLKYVDFDGHAWRGQPPEEFFLDAKEGYVKPIVDSPWPGGQRGQLDKFKKQAERQILALKQSGSQARLEWHFSDEKVADAVRAYFSEEGINVSVVFTPMVP